MEMHMIRIEPIFVLLCPPIGVWNLSFLQLIYHDLWKVILWLVKWPLLERIIASTLAMIDRRFLLKFLGQQNRSIKWLLAAKTNADEAT
jgi:hypothetical protein